MQKNLLIDTFGFVPKSTELVEDKNGQSRMIVRGEFSRAGIPTENNRIYPLALWERELKRISKAINERKVYGAADHPADGKTSLKNASHIITKLWVEGDRIMGEAQLLNTAAGRDIQAILEATGHLGVSSRGFGTTRPNQEGKDVVQDDYRLLTWDFVADPANITSYPSVQHESTEPTAPVIAGSAKMESKVDTKAPSLKETTVADKLTLESLRQNSPKVYESLRDEAEREFEKRGAKIWAQKIEQAKAEAAGELRASFAENLKTALETAKDEVAGQIRAQYDADPSVAGAKAALENLRAILRPYIMPEDVQAIVNAKDAEIQAVKNEMAERDLKIASLTKENKELADLAKEAGYKFHLEGLIKGSEFADLIRKTVGDVKQYESTDALNAKVSEIVAEVNKQKTKMEERDAEMARLKAENERLKKAAEMALEASNALAVQTYIESRLANHPRATEVRALIEGVELRTQEDVDSILAKFREKKLDRGQIEEARQRVRTLTGSTSREYLPEKEEGPRNQTGNGSVLSEDYNGLGQDASTLRTLSGINS